MGGFSTKKRSKLSYVKPWRKKSYIEDAINEFKECRRISAAGTYDIPYKLAYWVVHTIIRITNCVACMEYKVCHYCIVCSVGGREGEREGGVERRGQTKPLVFVLETSREMREYLILNTFLQGSHPIIMIYIYVCHCHWSCAITIDDDWTSYVTLRKGHDPQILDRTCELWHIWVDTILKWQPKIESNGLINLMNYKANNYVYYKGANKIPIDFRSLPNIINTFILQT